MNKYSKVSIGIFCLVMITLAACTSGTTENDKDRDGWLESEGDCDDFDAYIFPGSTDIAKDCDLSNDLAPSSASASSPNSFSSSSKSNDIYTQLLLAQNFVPQNTAGKLNYDFFKAIGAKKLRVTDSNITNAKLIVEAGSSNATSTTEWRPKSLAVGIYIGIFDRNTLVEKERYVRFLDAEWKNICNNLNTDRANLEGGVYFSGQIRRLEFDLSSPIPVSKENKCETGKDLIDLIDILKSSQRNNEIVMIGFYSSGAPFGLIRDARILYSGGEIQIEESY